MDNRGHYISIAGLQQDIEQKEKEYLLAISSNKPLKETHELKKKIRKMEKELALTMIANFDFLGGVGTV